MTNAFLCLVVAVVVLIAGSCGSGGAAGRPDAGPVSRLDAGKTVDVPRTDAAPPRPSDAGVGAIRLRVTNGCPFPLWVRGAGREATLQPDQHRLAPGAGQDYLAPPSWTAARVTAYLAAPDGAGRPQEEIEKVEMTFDKGTAHYNITYVDWVGLPSELRSVGTGDDCKPVGCPLEQADLIAGCPAGLRQGMRCLSLGLFCAPPDRRLLPLCRALDDAIDTCAGDGQRYPGCAGAAGASTADAYACAGFFAASPKWCAALNRGMIDDPENGDISRYYRSPAHNPYAKWVHATCPGIYAFPYDDYGKTNESGFHSCSGATEMHVTFCPGG